MLNWYSLELSNTGMLTYSTKQKVKDGWWGRALGPGGPARGEMHWNRIKRIVSNGIDYHHSPSKTRFNKAFCL